MKQFNLEEYLANPSKKVVTRDGRSVKIHCTNYIGAQHIIAQVEGHDYSTSFYEDGKYTRDRDDSHLDLFFAPEKHEGWINVYRSVVSRIYDSEEAARKKGVNAITTIKIEWEE